MKVRIITEAPEHIVSRGFNRLPWQDYDTVLIIRPGTDLALVADTINCSLLLSDIEEIET